MPNYLCGLTEIEEKLIAQITSNDIMYMNMLKESSQYGYKGHILNLAQDVLIMWYSLLQH